MDKTGFDLDTGKNLNDLYSVSRIIAQSSSLKSAMEKIIQIIRPIFIFDNLVIYRLTTNEKTLETVYARSTGRGRSAGADIAWGEAVAYQVVKSRQYIYQEPEGTETDNRLSQAFILAIPLFLTRQLLGVLVFIRYGGPKFIPESIDFAGYLATELVWLLGRLDLQERARSLDEHYKNVQMQEDFVNSITHELRNPLGFIKGYTTTLLRQDASWTLDAQREFLQIIDQETDGLNELIDNMLDSARIQSGLMAIEFRPVQINNLLNDVVQKFLLHNPAAKINLDLDAEITTVPGDSRRLAQVFVNLLSNAHKYAPKSRIEVSTKMDHDMIEIKVKDHGPGIPEEYLPHIFERFFRVPEQSISVRGTGLGLHICKQLIEAHHGQISVESKSGKGTTFIIKLGLKMDLTNPDDKEGDE